ncbi:MAG: CoA ester lyase [Xanthobacteraceae bacterium]
MRSFLFVPADSEKKLTKGLASAADALILDLEDSVVADRKPLARDIARAFLDRQVANSERPHLIVRVNARDSGLTEADLDAVMPARPDAIMLPKAEGGVDVDYLDRQLALRERVHQTAAGHTRILVVATETAKAIFQLGSYAGGSARLSGLTWGAEDLAADIGAESKHDADGRYIEPFRLARSLCLFGAVAAGVQPIDSVYPPFQDIEGLRRECEEARRDGFTGKMAIHPAQIDTINEVFTPSAAAVAEAHAVIAAFAANPTAGAVSLNGRMLDMPHLKLAQRLLARIKS